MSYPKSHKNLKPGGKFPIISGTDARNYRNADGSRRMGPYRVWMPVLMSPLSINHDVLEICLYGTDAKDVISKASGLLKRFYRSGKTVASPGHPKPLGEATLEVLEPDERDRSFAALYRDAQREAAAGDYELKALGPKDDPTAFHLKKTASRIIVS